ncbi:hypothetical protein AVEN_118204-1 [Araneus ventricosus]|uniref:DDE-1 domain-containing protein n=1 Tax=Araneus ventricosus TaxID=182803 RepID=A0A4Y2I085_ARAVE|nr:hypothetical protein AVEN_118204-1 [Araneus ventricosus]
MRIETRLFRALQTCLWHSDLKTEMATPCIELFAAEANMETASNASDIIKSVTVLDAVMWLSKAWKEISKQTIRKCFVEANFPENVCIEKHSSTEDIDVRDQKILLNNGNFSDMSAKEFISIDDDIDIDN